MSRPGPLILHCHQSSIILPELLIGTQVCGPFPRLSALSSVQFIQKQRPGDLGGSFF